MKRADTTKWCATASIEAFVGQENNLSSLLLIKDFFLLPQYTGVIVQLP